MQSTALQACASTPCFFWNLCETRAALEKAGRSVCHACAGRLRGREYPLRGESQAPHLWPSGAVPSTRCHHEGRCAQKPCARKKTGPRDLQLLFPGRKPCAFADDPQKGITMSANALSHRAAAVLAAAGWLAALYLAVLVARSWQASRKTAGNMRAAFAAQD